MKDRPQLVRLQQRQTLTRAMRTFFWEQNFLEVDTPIALSAPAPERHIHAIPIALHGMQGPSPARRFLQPSPELPMKRLLAALRCNLFQWAAVFRDERPGPFHLPEFRMLEWYRMDADEHDLMADCEQLWLHCLACLDHQEDTLLWQGHRYDITVPFLRRTVDELCESALGLCPSAYRQQRDFYTALRSKGVYCQEDDSWDELFHRLWISHLAPTLISLGRPVFVTHFPAALGSLAALDGQNPAVARRFEWFMGELELANGFLELTQSQEQRRRFQEELAYRAARQQIIYPLDETFLDGLDSIGQAAGIALGIERLLMVLLNASTIDDVTCLKWNQT